jgi:hypothetical protein
MMLLSSTSQMFQKAGMLAADGRCKALDAAADGYVRSEALAMMLMATGEVEGALALLAGELRPTLIGRDRDCSNSVDLS